jgi:hypothetical protein
VSLSTSFRGSERFIEPFEFLTPHEEAELLRGLTYFDRRHDYRFGKAVLYKNSTDSIVAKIKHRFDDFPIFKRYCEKYEQREKVSSMYLMRILYLYNSKVEEAREEHFTINLIIEYPYNDLKSEINLRLVDNRPFAPQQIQKMLKAGVGALSALKKAGYNYPFQLSQYSMCIFEKPNEKLAFRILEFSNFDSDLLDEPEDLVNLYSENCKSLAMIVIEAGLLINKDLLAENCDELIALRFLDQFLTRYSDNREMCQIIESFIHQNDVVTLEKAERNLFKDRADKNQRYLFQDDQIVVQTQNKRLTRFDAEKMKAKIK